MKPETCVRCGNYVIPGYPCGWCKYHRQANRALMAMVGIALVIAGVTGLCVVMAP